MQHSRPTRYLAAILLFAAFAPHAHAQDAPIRIWGHGHRGQDYILTLLRAWEAAYQKQHPEARFDNQLTGDASAMGGLWTNSADLALLDRRASFIEDDGYEQGTGHKPFGIQVANGSVSTAHHAPALVLYVNKANPLTRLTMQQVDAIFDADHRIAHARLTTWGDLGLTGVFADRKINLYTLPIVSAQVQHFEHAAMHGSQKFSCCLTTKTSAAGLTAALAADKFGIALSDAPLPGMKPIALSAIPNHEVLPTPATIISREYPLGRDVFLYANRSKHEPAPANVAGFMAFIVSDEGQAIVAKTGGYLPLSPEAAAQSKEALR